MARTKNNNIIEVPAKAVVKNLNRIATYTVGATYDEVLDILNEIDQLSVKFNEMLVEKKAAKIEELKAALAELEA